MSTSSFVFPTQTLGTSVFSSILPANSTSSISTATPSTTSDLSPEPTDPGDDDDPDSKQNSLLYYYFFIFLVLVIGVIIITCLAYHRRRKLRKALHRNNGQNALQRDLEGWSPGTHRLFPMGTRALNRNARQQDEGFNEYGEAPPAYKPKDESISRPRTDESVSTLDVSAAPLQSQPQEGGLKLPKYDEIVKDIATESETQMEASNSSTLRLEGQATSVAPSQQPSQTRTP